MKEKSNIFEELNKMKSLIYAKSGTVISEQANVGADVGTVMRELQAAFNADEDVIVNTIKKYKDKASFKSFVDQYNATTGKDFGTQLIYSIGPNNDRKEWNELSKHLQSIGITLGSETTNRGNSSKATFAGLDTPAAAVKNTDDLWKTTYSCVTTQPGAKAVKTNNAGTAYLVGQIYYYANGRKKLADGTMVNYSCSTEFKKGNTNSRNRVGQSSINSRFTKSAESLGIKGGKMDLQTLQSIIKTLESGETPSTPATSATPTGTPDLAQLTSIINQLNA